MAKVTTNETMTGNKNVEPLTSGDVATKAFEQADAELDKELAKREKDVAMYNATIKERPLEFERLESEALGDYIGSYELKNDTDETFQKAFYANLALFKQKQKDFKRAYSEMLAPLATMVNCEHYKKLQDAEMSKSANAFIKNLLGCSKAYASNIKDVVTKFYNKKGELINPAYTVFSIGQLIALTKASKDALQSITERYALACDELGKPKLTDAEFKRWLEVTENTIILENLGIEPPKPKTNKEDKKDEKSEKSEKENEIKQDKAEPMSDDDGLIIEPNYKELFKALAALLFLSQQGYEFDYDVNLVVEFVLEDMLNEQTKEELIGIVESKAKVSYPILKEYVELVKGIQYKSYQELEKEEEA